MKMKLLASVGVLLVHLALFPIWAGAQEREPVTHNQVISGSPLLLLNGWFNAEYEWKLTDDITAGFAGGWLDVSRDDYTFFTGFLRLYPRGGAFSGFYLGGRGGIFRVNEAPHGEGNSQENGEDHTAPGIGVDLGYTWLLGPGRSFFVGLGIGGTHLFGDLGNAGSNIPNLRLLDVGIAF